MDLFWKSNIHANNYINLKFQIILLNFKDFFEILCQFLKKYLNFQWF